MAGTHVNTHRNDGGRSSDAREVERGYRNRIDKEDEPDSENLRPDPSLRSSVEGIVLATRLGGTNGAKALKRL